MSEHKAIFKSASAISVITIVSRITGFVRDVLIASFFGTGIAAQAFFVAFKIPNMFRDVMGEGAGNAAFVPVFCEYLEKKPRLDFLRLVNSLLQWLLASSFLICLAGIFFSPIIVRLIAPGFFQDAVKFDLTVALNRLLFPYLILITISAYLMSVSNALKSFAVPAASSIVFNVVLIAFIFLIGLFFSGTGEAAGMTQIKALSIAVLLAGAAQVLMQLPPLLKKGIDFKRGGIYSNFFKEEGIKKISRLMFPRLLGTSIYQLNIFVDTIFGSLVLFMGEGAIAAIYYANRIIQFPFAIFGVALSNAALPTMSTNSANRDMEKFKATITFCLKSVFLGIIPVMAGILIFAAPLVQVIFQRGSFDAYSTDITARAVFFYALGLVAYVGVRILAHAFYAFQDTVTPVKTSSIALFSNILFASLFTFLFKWQISGLALASSISASLNFYLLYRILKRKTGFVFDTSLRRILLKSAMASVAMAAVIFWIWQRWFSHHPTFVKMLAVGSIGAIIYILFLWLLKVEEIARLLSWYRKRK